MPTKRSYYVYLTKDGVVKHATEQEVSTLGVKEYFDRKNAVAHFKAKPGTPLENAKKALAEVSGGIIEEPEVTEESSKKKKTNKQTKTKSKTNDETEDN